MKKLIDRSHCIVLLGLWLLCATAGAQTYPARPIQLVVPYTAGGPADAIARPVFERVGEILGQQVLIVNRGGSSGEIGTTSVATAPPDGYTLLLATTGANVNSIALGRPVRYTAASFQPITMIVEIPSLLVVRPGLPIQDMKDLIAYAKANPGKLNYGTLGTGSTPQIALKTLNRSAGLDIREIPYPGVAAVLTDFLGDRLDIMSGVVGSLAPHVQAGKLRAVGLLTPGRSSVFPELRPLSETVPGFVPVTSWIGLMAPAGTPKPIIDRLYQATAEALRSPSVAEQMRKLAATIVANRPEAFTASINQEIATWTEQFRLLGIGKE